MSASPLSASLLRQPVHFLALGFGSGLAPKAPGTAGTLVAMPAAWLLLGWPLATKLALITLMFVAGVWICGESARRLGVHDHPAIVWDEIVGLLATCVLLPADPRWLPVAFVLFRFFDIAKPWPIRDVDHRLGGGIGIMLDDIVAAAFAAICLLFARSIPIL
ncbi:MAG: phosphatidylglycerophosphatase A family protein [Gammaproteobacteria bacterium]